MKVFMILFLVLSLSSCSDENPNIELFKAIDKNDYSHLKQFIEEKNLNINYRTDFGLTPLLYAANLGYSKLVKLLLENGADINARDKQGKTALYCSITWYYPSTWFGLKFKMNENPDKKADNFNKVMDKNGVIKTISILIEYGADINERNRVGHNLLMHAVFEHRSSIRRDYTEIIKYLLEKGVDPKATEEYSYSNPLYHTIDYPKITKLLLKYGAKNIADSSGKTPLYYAKFRIQNNEKKYLDIKKLLLTYKKKQEK